MSNSNTSRSTPLEIGNIEIGMYQRYQEKKTVSQHGKNASQHGKHNTKLQV